MPAAAVSPVPEPDIARLRQERFAKLQAQMGADGLDALVLLHAPHVGYATDCLPKGIDATHASATRPVAVVVADHPHPCLLGGDHDGLNVALYPEVWPDIDEGAADLGAQLDSILGRHAHGGRIGVDLMTGAMRRTGVLSGAEIADAANTMGRSQAPQDNRRTGLHPSSAIPYQPGDGLGIRRPCARRAP